MKIRISGSADLVQAWADRFVALGISGRIYPNRGGDGVRWYADIDDRVAAKIDSDKLLQPTKPVRKKRAGGRP